MAVQFTVTASATGGSMDPFSQTVTPPVVELGAFATIYLTPDTGMALPQDVSAITITPSGSTSGSASYSIEGDRGKITVVGIKRSINVHATCDPIMLTVTDSIANGSCNAPGTVNYGSNIDCRITPATGYELDELVEPIVFPDDGYDNVTYAKNFGRLRITNVKKDISILYVCKAKTYQVSTSNILNGSCDAPSTATYGSNLTGVQITPSTGHLYPSSVSVTPTEHRGSVSYDPSTGVLSVNNILGDIDIAATCDPIMLTVTDDFSCGYSTAPQKVAYGSSLSEVIIIANPGYNPSTHVYTEPTNHRDSDWYVRRETSSGVLRGYLDVTNITGDIRILGDCVAIQYPIYSTHVEGGTLTLDQDWSSLEDAAQATLTADVGHTVPDSVSAVCGVIENYEKPSVSTATFTIKPDVSNLGDIYVYAQCEPIQLDVEEGVVGGRFTQGDRFPVPYGSGIPEMKLTLEPGYFAPPVTAIYPDPSSSCVGFSYVQRQVTPDPRDFEGYLTVESVVGDFTISGKCGLLRYDISYHPTGCSISGSPNYVTVEDPTTITVTASKGYRVPTDLGGATISHGSASDYSYAEDRSSATFTLSANAEDLGDVSVTIACEAYPYIEEGDTDYCTLSNLPTNVEYNGDLYVQIVPSKWYTWPDSDDYISVNGPHERDEYDSRTGMISIFGITGNLTINATCHLDSYPIIAGDLAHCSMTSGASVTVRSPATINITAEEGYRVPTDQEAGFSTSCGYISGYEVIDAEHATFDVYLNQSVDEPPSDGKIRISGSCPIKTFTVSEGTVGHGSLQDLPATVEYGHGIEVLVSPDKWYTWPESDEDFTITGAYDAENLSYNSSSGVLTIPGITSDITISVSCVYKRYSISGNVSGGTIEAGTLTKISSSEVTLRADRGCLVPTDESALTLSPGGHIAGYEYAPDRSSATFEVFFQDADEAGDITITGSCETASYVIDSDIVNGVMPNTPYFLGVGDVPPDLDLRARNGYIAPIAERFVKIEPSGAAEMSYQLNNEDWGILSFSNISSSFTVKAECPSAAYRVTMEATKGTWEPKEGTDPKYIIVDTNNPNAEGDWSLTPVVGYSRPSEVTVTGEYEHDDPMYDPSTGNLHLFHIESDISLSAVCEMIVYSVSWNCIGGDIDTASTLTVETPASVTITANDGYVVPESGDDITAEHGVITNYSRDSSGSSAQFVLSLNKEDPGAGAVSMAVECEAKIVSVTVEHGSSNWTPGATVTSKEDFEIKITPEEHYGFPKNVSVTNATGTLNEEKKTITISAPTGPVSVHAVCPPDEFDITTDYTGIVQRAISDTTISYLGEATIYLVPTEQGYSLPPSVSVSPSSAAHVIKYVRRTGEVVLKSDAARGFTVIASAIESTERPVPLGGGVVVGEVTEYESDPRDDIAGEYSIEQIERASLHGESAPRWRICILNPDDTVREEIPPEDIAVGGSYSESYQNGQRRSLSFTLYNDDGKYTPGVNGMWLTTRVSLEMGIVMPDGGVAWFKRGVYVVNQPTVTHSSDHETVQVSAGDKWTLFSGALGALESTYEIPANSRIADVIGDILMTDRETGIPLDSKPPSIHPAIAAKRTQATITMNAGQTYADLLLELATQASAEIFYNSVGTLTLVPLTETSFDDGKPSLWDFGEDQVQGLDFSFSAQEIFNRVIVIGSTANGQYHRAEASNTDPQSPTSVGRIGVRTASIINDSNITADYLAEERAQYELRRILLLRTPVSLTAPINPFVMVNGVVTMTSPALKMARERFVVQSVSYPLDYSGTMTVSASSVWNLPFLTQPYEGKSEEEEEPTTDSVTVNDWVLVSETTITGSPY